MTVTTTTNTLPKSVRGCDSLELRRLIRKKQNSESAKRCRLRRKEEALQNADSNISATQKMANLEACIANLANSLVQTQNLVAVLLANANNNNNTPTPPTAQSPRYPVNQQSHPQFFQPTAQVSTEPAIPVPVSLPDFTTTTNTTAGTTTATDAIPVAPTTLTLEIPPFDIVAASSTSAIPTSPTTPPVPAPVPQSPAATISLSAQSAAAAYDNIFDDVTSQPEEVGSPFSDFHVHNFSSPVGRVG